ncbi:MAG: hypothetical protein Q9165_007410 [Trypethelium subeluteriae]
MDHLFMPYGACSQVDDEVYYQGSKEYLKHNFLDFAVVKGYSFLLDSPLKPADGIKDYDLLMAPKNLDRFLQEWLFFSFLKEVFHDVPRKLHCRSMFRHADFIHSSTSSPSKMTQKPPGVREESDSKVREAKVGRHVLHINSLITLVKNWVKGILSRLHKSVSGVRRPVLSTKSLVTLANKWTKKIEPVSRNSTEQYKHLVKCVSTVSGALQYISMRPSISEEYKKEYDSRTIAVIAATTDFVVTMISKTFENTENTDINGHILIDRSSWVLFGWRDVYMERMVSMGWCPHAAASMKKSAFPVLQVIHFCTNLRRYGALDHKDCTRETCQASAGSSVARHKSTCEYPAVDCNAFAVEGDLMKEMLHIIQVDGLPLLKMRNHGDKLEIHLVPRKKGDNYIALSHVWSDGMGNKSSNSLPWCQLESLHSKLSKIPRERPGAEGDELLVWIDTICCPLKVASQEPERIKVMGQMVKIYSDAEFVFVLDSELELTDNKYLSELEIAFRTLNSNWMRRLWTLQEGYFAKKLWVQFKNGAFELDQDGIKKMNLNNVSTEQYWVARTTKTLYTSLRRSSMSKEVDKQSESTFRAMALQSRSVTEPSDEPLCIATVFNLGADGIEAIGEEDDCVNKRMKELWILMNRSTHGIPKSVLFHNAPRLPINGFHWAPASLLDKAALPLVRALFAGSSMSSATISGSGLRVQSEGILLPQKRNILRCLKKHRRLGSISILDDSVIYLRDNADRWYIFWRPQSSDQILGSGLRQPDTRDRTEAGNNERAASRKVVRYGVIFRDNSVDRHPASPPSGEGLLVAVHESEDQAQLVTAIETVFTNRVMPDQEAVWEVAYQMTEAIRKSEDFKIVERRDAERQEYSSVSEEESSDAECVERYALAWVQEQIDRDSSIIAKLKRTGLNADFMKATVRRMLAGSLGMDVEFQTSDHVWCVD